MPNAPIPFIIKERRKNRNGCEAVIIESILILGALAIASVVMMATGRRRYIDYTIPLWLVPLADLLGSMFFSSVGDNDLFGMHPSLILTVVDIIAMLAGIAAAVVIGGTVKNYNVRNLYLTAVIITVVLMCLMYIFSKLEFVWLI